MKERKAEKPYKIIFCILLSVLIFFLLLCTLNNTVFASTFVDTKIDNKHLFSKYPLDNYQLDFYVDTSWDWLPWNWTDGIGDGAMYAVYMLTDAIWYISRNISNATGYVVQEAFNLDFVSDLSSTVGKSIQTLAGVTKSGGVSKSGLIGGFLLMFVLVLGVYVLYVGLLKRETTKAMNSVLSFILIFIVSVSFIAYAPDYIKKINSFSSDVATSVLNAGTSLIAPDSDSTTDGAVAMREQLFSIQVRQPWLLMQFGNTSVNKIGNDRVKALESVSPDDDDGETRQDAVEKEIEDEENKNLTVTKVAPRLGMVLFLFLFNIGISAFVLYLCGLMIFSQILFVGMAIFAPFVCVLAMLPTFGGNVQKYVLALFNTLMVRAGYTLVMCIAFTISTMFYSISGNYPFFMVMFLQIVTFAGIGMNHEKILGLIGLKQSGTSGKTVMRKAGRRAKRTARTVGTFLLGKKIGQKSTDDSSKRKQATGKNTANQNNKNGIKERANSQKMENPNDKKNKKKPDKTSTNKKAMDKKKPMDEKGKKPIDNTKKTDKKDEKRTNLDRNKQQTEKKKGVATTGQRDRKMTHINNDTTTETKEERKTENRNHTTKNTERSVAKLKTEHTDK